jgi:hypothetical protein
MIDYSIVGGTTHSCCQFFIYVAKNMELFFNTFSLIFSLWPNLAKSSYGIIATLATSQNWRYIVTIPPPSPPFSPYFKVHFCYWQNFTQKAKSIGNLKNVKMKWFLEFSNSQNSEKQEMSDFYISFQKVARSIKWYYYFLKLSYPILYCSQIWLNLPTVVNSVSICLLLVLSIKPKVVRDATTSIPS